MKSIFSPKVIAGIVVLIGFVIYAVSNLFLTSGEPIEEVMSATTAHPNGFTNTTLGISFTGPEGWDDLLSQGIHITDDTLTLLHMTTPTTATTIEMFTIKQTLNNAHMTSENWCTRTIPCLICTNSINRRLYSRFC
ncbi:MAG: hypothetical protein ACRDDX_15175 [Cellulosilyticaceae bacterium]